MKINIQFINVSKIKFDLIFDRCASRSMSGGTSSFFYPHVQTSISDIYVERVVKLTKVHLFTKKNIYICRFDFRSIIYGIHQVRFSCISSILIYSQFKIFQINILINLFHFIITICHINMREFIDMRYDILRNILKNNILHLFLLFEKTV